MPTTNSYRGATEADEERYCSLFSGVRCWNCRFFDEFEPMNCVDQIDENGVIAGTRIIWEGTCRRHAPKPIVIPNVDTDMETRWPPVRGDDFCGEHVPVVEA
jgi:hypothetical protein